MFLFRSKKGMRVLQMAIVVVSRWVYGMCMVRFDVVFGKIGLVARVGFDDAGYVL